MTLLEEVKLALRIRHDYFDPEITEDIAAAQAEMKRAGVSSEVIEENGPLVKQALKTYTKAYLAPTLDDRDRYLESFNYQLDCLRKSPQEASEDV